jgi:competence protein ComEC
MERLNYSYKLLKAPGAAWLERHHLQRGLRYAFAAVLTSVCVQLTLLPLLIWYFHRVSISSVVLNIGISLLMALLIFTGIVALLLAQVSTGLAAPFISATNALDFLMVHGVDPFARIGLASLRLPEYSGHGFFVYVLFYVPLLFLTLRLLSWNLMKRPDKTRLQIGVGMRGAVGVQLVMVAIVIAHPFSADAPQGKLQIDFLDVGQGDAAFVTLPDGTTLLVDGGGRPSFVRKKPDEEAFERDSRSIGEAVVSEYLWWRGLDHVDYLIATHADADHIDGLNDVARNFRVRGALVARAPASDPEFSEFETTLNNQGIPLVRIGSDDQLQFGQASARVLWPRPRADSQAASFNNDSIVLRLDFGSRSVLFLADIESAGEIGLLGDLKRTGNESAVHADVVKVAHHGSKTSSTREFVKATGALFAVISVGQHSMFGHPHRTVVERWRAAGAEILTTGDSGTITVTTDGRELWMRKFLINKLGTWFLVLCTLFLVLCSLFLVVKRSHLVWFN